MPRREILEKCFLPTSHVGSMPAENISKNVETQIEGSTPKAVRTQIEAGLDIPTTGQMSMYFYNDMVLPYILSIEGLGRRKDEENEVENEISSHPKRRIVVEEVIAAINELRKFPKTQTLGLRVPITGPTTIAYSIPRYNRGGYKTPNKLIEDVAEKGLKPMLEEIVKYPEVSVISFNEPAWTDYYGSEDGGISVIKDLSDFVYEKGKKEKVVILHVCGLIRSKLFEKIVKIDGIDFLDLEFTEFPGNLKVIDPDLLEDNRKRLAVGCINPYTPYTESEDSVIKTLDSIRKIGVPLEKIMANRIVDCVSEQWMKLKRNYK